MNMRNWFSETMKTERKKAMPVLSFPSTTLMGLSVKEFIADSDTQAKGMKIIADRCDTAASVSPMDLSVEAEAFGSSIRVDAHEVPTVVGRIIETEEDSDNLIVPSVGAGRTGTYIEAMEKAVSLIADRPIFAGTIGPFSLAGRLMDMTEIMINCIEEPEMVHKTLAKVTDFLIEYTNAYKATGCHGVVIAEPAAGILSPGLALEFSSQYVKKIVDTVQSDDFAVIYHNCGNTVPLVESIKSIGAFGYHFGNAIEMTDILPLMPPDVTVFGNVEPSGQFKNGTPESVYAATTEILNKCSKYPNFVISSGCDIPPLSPWENIDAFFNAVSDFYK